MKSSVYTPMMTQYLEIKKQYPDTLIFFRLGDFYEMFFEDAKTASRELELVLTGRDAGVSERVPMCGVPHHAVKGYLDRLIKKGYKVGIVEQLEDPALAKGIVKRDVVQIVTPGTLIDVGLEESTNNYLVGVEDASTLFVLSFCDLSTGELGVMSLERDLESLLAELETLETKEIVVSPEFDPEIREQILARRVIRISTQSHVEPTLEYEALMQNIHDARHIRGLTALVSYLVATQRRSLDYLRPATRVVTSQHLQMDAYTRTNLELFRTVRSEDRYGSLLWVLDKTKTAMGARLLKQFVARPLADRSTIEARLDIVEAFLQEFLIRPELGDLLAEIYDLPRLIGRIGYGNANARDLVQLAKSLAVVPTIRSKLASALAPALQKLAQTVCPMPQLTALIQSSIVDNPPFTIKEGGMIRSGYHPELDELKAMSRGGKEWIAALETSERERTGIKNLKVGFNKVFGFYLEISKGSLGLVRPDFGYERKQTLANSERFITPELKEKEALVLHAEDRIIQLEYELFLDLREQVKQETEAIQQLADTLATLDVLRAFAVVADTQHYVRPSFNDYGRVEVFEGRHPVIEKVMVQQAYVPNDIRLDRESFLQIITGPNMGGKSTYMRQVALTVIMAQIGSYVPASKAELPVFDRIFTRIGASDDLVSGQSTFMVEMIEANHAIRHATEHSLILFDEIGRGTSTYDGMALAQAIIEHLAVYVKALTLFSTHYHELTELEQKLPGIRNIHVAVHEENDRVTFLYQVKVGSAAKSYGINVARLAKLPDPLLTRAQEILHQFETKQISLLPAEYVVRPDTSIPEWQKELESIDPLAISPLEALHRLVQWKKQMKE